MERNLLSRMLEGLIAEPDAMPFFSRLRRRTGDHDEKESALQDVEVARARMFIVSAVARALGRTVR
jgi:hypothetical protein